MKGFNENFLYKTTAFDKALIGVILGSCLIVLLWLRYRAETVTALAHKAYIYKEHALIRELPLLKDTRISLADGKMDIEVKDGSIRVARSDCPRRTCMSMGWIHHGGQTIVCVPYRIVIEIKAIAQEAAIDSVVY